MYWFIFIFTIGNTWHFMYHDTQYTVLKNRLSARQDTKPIKPLQKIPWFLNFKFPQNDIIHRFIPMKSLKLDWRHDWKISPDRWPEGATGRPTIKSRGGGEWANWKLKRGRSNVSWELQVANRGFITSFSHNTLAWGCLLYRILWMLASLVSEILAKFIHV